MSKISVIVPNYNHARYLPERLDSILAQTRMPDEIILLDDTSSDNSCEILQEYAARYPDLVTCHFNEENSGTPFAQWKKGVELAHGDFIWIAESDDVADPHLLERLAPMLEADPKVGIAYCQSRKIGDKGEDLGDMYSWTDPLNVERWRSRFTNDGHDECVKYLSCRNTIPNASAVLFRRAAYEYVSDMPLSFRLSGDWLVWVTILRKYAVSYTPQMLNSFRHHDVSVRAKTRDVKFRAESWCIRQHILDELTVSSGDKPKILGQQLHVIGQALQADDLETQPHMVIDEYKKNLNELFAELNRVQLVRYAENTNVYIPLAMRLADFGNIFYNAKRYNSARQFYLASLNYRLFSIRVMMHVLSTYFPLLRKIVNKLNW